MTRHRARNEREKGNQAEPNKAPSQWRNWGGGGAECARARERERSEEGNAAQLHRPALITNEAGRITLRQAGAQLPPILAYCGAISRCYVKRGRLRGVGREREREESGGEKSQRAQACVCARGVSCV